MAQIEARAAVRARRVVAVSRQLRGPLAARHHLDERDGTVLPNGVDTARFASGRLAVVGGVPEPREVRTGASRGAGSGVLGRAEEHAGYVEMCEARRLARSHQVRSEGDLRLGSKALDRCRGPI